MAYDFYLDNELLPIAPSKVQMKVKNQNKTLNLINHGEINLLKDAGLTSIDFEVVLPNMQYPFSKYKDGFKPAKEYLKKLESLKKAKGPFQFIITRMTQSGRILYYTNLKVSLEEYTIKEDAKDGLDVIVMVKLKQFKDFATKIISLPRLDEKTVRIVKKREVKNSPMPKVTAKTYKVVKGDSLWSIAKRFYGDGAKHSKITEVNKLESNTIHVGQHLTIPV